VRRHAFLILLLSVGGTWILFGFRVAGPVALGGLLAFLSFGWLTAAVDPILTGRKRHRPGIVILGFVGRTVLILVCLFAMIQLSFESLMGALLGLSVFVLAGIVEAVLLLLQK
jgi:hypothetical protein